MDISYALSSTSKILLRYISILKLYQKQAGSEQDVTRKSLKSALLVLGTIGHGLTMLLSF